MADFPQMNFTQMHERLRLELLRRIQRGSLSVSLLSRQTGFGQAHLSNFLHSRRHLSLDALDRILAAQRMAADDLLPAQIREMDLPVESRSNRVPVVTHSAALFEPVIRSSAVHGIVEVPASFLRWRARPSPNRRRWERFVAISVPAADSLPMDPIVMPDALLILDRHWNSLVQYRPHRPNLYAVRQHSHLAIRYLDFLLNRLVLRPHNIAFPVDLVEIPPGESPNDAIAGRVTLILNEP
jgi:hypothetical protein